MEIEFGHGNPKALLAIFVTVFALLLLGGMYLSEKDKQREFELRMAEIKARTALVSPASQPAPQTVD